MKLDFRDTAKKAVKREIISVPPFVSTILMFFIGVVLLITGISFVLSLFFQAKVDGVYAYAMFDQVGSEGSKGHLTVAWISDKKKEIAIVQFPDSVEFVSPSVGAYPISSVYTAYTQSATEAQTIRTELSIFLRTRIQSFFAASQPVHSSKRSLLSFVFQACLGGEGNHPGIQPCLQLLKVILSPSYTIREVVFPNTLLAEATAIGVKPLKRQAYRTWLSDRFSDSFGFNGQTLSIVNASGVSGVAKEASLIFEDLGFSVLSLTDASSRQEKGQLLVNSDQVADEHLLQFLASFFHLELESHPSSKAGYRTQLVVIIGTDQVKFFTAQN